MMDSIGGGELLVIALLTLFLVDPRKVGHWVGKLRGLQRRLLAVREDVEREIRQSMEPPEPRRQETLQRLRRWSRDRVSLLGLSELEQGGSQALARLKDWDLYSRATDVCLYMATEGEIPTRPLLEAVLADGKRLWLPYALEAPGEMEMARIDDIENDLAPGKYRLLEPVAARRGAEQLPEGALVLAPGSVFDLHGGRIGKGMGYYDRYFARRPDCIRAGLAWDAQVHPGRIPMAAHDVQMQHLLTERRFLHFAAANTSVEEESQG